MDEAKKHIRNLLYIMEENPPEDSYVMNEDMMIREAEDFLDKDVSDGWDVLKDVYIEIKNRQKANFDNYGDLRYKAPELLDFDDFGVRGAEITNSNILNNIKSRLQKAGIEVDDVS